MSNAAQTDSEYKRKVDQVINHHNHQNKEFDDEQTLKIKSIENEFEKTKKQQNDDRFDKIEQQIAELKQLILAQNKNKNQHKNDNISLLSPPINKRKKVTFKDRNDGDETLLVGHKHRATNFDHDSMQKQIMKIKENENMNEEEEEYHQEENDNNEQMITPRIPSHARSNAPISHLTQISDLDIGGILPKNKSTAL